MPLTQQDREYMKSQGLNPDDFETVETQGLAKPSDWSPEDLEYMKSQGLNPDEFQPVSQPPGTVAGAPSSSGASASGDVDIAEAFGRGVREAVAPGTVTEGEIKESADAEVPEVLAEMAGMIGADIAALTIATKAGATLGSFVAPGIGTGLGAAAGMLGYAIYSGLAQEDLAEKRTGEYSGARAAARVALNINPMARYGGALGKAFTKVAGKAADPALAALKAGEQAGARATRLGAQVAGETAVAASEFGAGAATAAGAISLALHGLGFRKGITPADSKRIGAFSETKEAQDLAVKIGKRFETEAPQINTATYSDELVDDQFARFVLNDYDRVKSPINRAKRYIDEGVENPDDLYRSYLRQNIINEEMAKASALAKAELQKGGKFLDDLDPTSGAGAKIRDGQNVAREVDRRLPVGMTRKLNNISEDRGVFENTQLTLANAAKKAYKIQKKAGISDDEMGKLRIVLGGEDGSAQFREGIERLFDPSGKLSPGAEGAVKAWNSVWDSAKQVIVKNGFKVNTMPVYFPTKRISGFELADSIEKTIGQINAVTNEKIGRNIRQWTPERLVAKAGMDEVEAKALVESIAQLRMSMKKHGVSRKDMRVESLHELRDAVLGTKPRPSPASEVGAVFKRGESVIPAKFRETNNRQAFVNYLNSNVKGAIMAKSTREMAALGEAMNRNGYKDTASWINTMLDDISGGVRSSPRQWFVDKTSKARYAIHKGMQKENKNWQEHIGWNSANFAMETLGAWQGSIYPSLLAFNVPAMARNLTQNLTMTAPEIGGTYGYNVAMRSLAKNPWKHAKRLKEDGVLARGATAEALRPEDSKFLAKWGKMGDEMLRFYTGTDKINRMWSYNIGHTMAGDLARGNKLAIEALDRLGPAVKATLAEAGLTSQDAFNKNRDQLGDLIGKMLIGKTQFHYGAEQKAEFLRTMGPMFSMFTKWPVSTTSDIGTILRENPKFLDRAHRYMERYGGLWIAMAYAGTVHDKDDGFMSYMVRNPVSLAPGYSPTTLGLFNNPQVEAALAIPSVAKQVFSADDPTKILKKIAEQGLKTGLGPVSAVINEIDRLAKSKTIRSKTVADELFGE